VTSALRADPPRAVSRLHLTEGRDGWTVTLTLTPELLAVIADAGRTGEPISCASGVVGRMHVEPNLVPGEPFDLREITVVPLPEAPPSAVTRKDPTKARDA
jgi:hypothetical protein